MEVPTDVARIEEIGDSYAFTSFRIDESVAVPDLIIRNRDLLFLVEFQEIGT